MTAPELLAFGQELGDRFVAIVGEPDTGGWLRAEELFGAGLPAALLAVGRRRGTDSAAVAGVLLFEQYAQRLVAPALAALLRDHAVLDVRPAVVRVELVDGAIRRLAFARAPEPAEGDPEETHARVARALLAGHLDGVAEAVRIRSRVGSRLLRGSIANAIANALLHLSWPDRVRDRHVPDARRFLARRADLAALVTVESVRIGGEAWMYTDRNTCCLAFRTTINQARDQHYCATCPVVPRSDTRALFAEATASYSARHPR